MLKNEIEKEFIKIDPDIVSCLAKLIVIKSDVVSAINSLKSKSNKGALWVI